MAQITIDDKVQHEANPLPDINKWTAADINHFKAIINENDDDVQDHKTDPSAHAAAIAAAIAALVDASPATLDTLNEIAAALGDDPNFATTILAAIGLRALTTDVVGVQDLYIDASLFIPRTTNGCSPHEQYENGTSRANFVVLPFDNVSQEFAQFSMNLPRNWNNVNFTCVVDFFSRTTTGQVKWNVRASVFRDGDALNGAFGTAQAMTKTVSAAEALQKTSESAAVVPAGTAQDGNTLLIQIDREPGGETGGLAEDALFKGIRLSVTTDAAKAA